MHFLSPGFAQKYSLPQLPFSLPHKQSCMPFCAGAELVVSKVGNYCRTLLVCVTCEPGSACLCFGRCPLVVFPRGGSSPGVRVHHSMQPYANYHSDTQNMCLYFKPAAPIGVQVYVYTYCWCLVLYLRLRCLVWQVLCQPDAVGDMAVCHLSKRTSCVGRPLAIADRTDLHVQAQRLQSLSPIQVLPNACLLIPSTPASPLHLPALAVSACKYPSFCSRAFPGAICASCLCCCTQQSSMSQSCTPASHTSCRDAARESTGGSKHAPSSLVSQTFRQYSIVAPKNKHLATSYF